MISLEQIKSILAANDRNQLESLAHQASQVTQQYFGRTISLYAPIYLSNHCNSGCLYCGFNRRHAITRIKLTEEQMHSEMKRVAETGIENILLLTGESPLITPLTYLKTAVQIAKKYFSSISLEVFPMGTKDYHELFLSGVDGMTIYQETYDQTVYKRVHPSGEKSKYPYRYEAPQRMAEAGIRYISMGILLGLHENIAEDLYKLYQHLKEMEKSFPGVEYSLSFPRLQKIKGVTFSSYPVDDVTFIKIICLSRLKFPRVGINLTTRENAFMRDHLLGLGVTRISAGSKTSVGGYTIANPEEQDTQFNIDDTRSVQEIIRLLKNKTFDPVLTDWRRIPNEMA